jgi:hypothetical protein
MRLHNSLVYAHLGYFDRFAGDYEHLKRRLRVAGFALSGAVRGAPPVFMHTVNHPRIEVLFALARQAVRLVGLTPRGAVPPDDELARGYIWPVYPEIARRLGVDGNQAGSAYGNPISLDAICHSSFRAFENGGIGQPLPPAVDRAREFIKREALGSGSSRGSRTASRGSPSVAGP